jgi:hypothetical protein
MRAIGILFLAGTLWALGACGGGDGGSDDTAAGEDSAVTDDTAGGDDTSTPAASCTLTVASYVAMTKFVELKNDDASCLVSFKVAPDKDGAPDWDNMVKSGSVIEVVEGWDPPKANVKYPCDDPQGAGTCGGQTGTVTLTTFEPTAADCQEGGSVTGKKIVGSVDASSDRVGNRGSAKFSFDLTF